MEMNKQTNEWTWERMNTWLNQWAKKQIWGFHDLMQTVKSLKDRNFCYICIMY